MSIFKKFGPLVALVWLALACSGQDEQVQKERRPSVQEMREQRIQAQRDFLQKEEASIQQYVADRSLNMERSGSGLYYQIERDSSNLEDLTEGDLITYSYAVFLLNGRALYSSEQDGLGRLVLNKQDAIIGLHQALDRMTLGDTGRFIIPSHLAYGVAGDQKNVPPLTALEYHLKILNVEQIK